VRYWAALWLLLVSALIPREAEAHDGLPISVVIEERADGLFRLDLALPPSVPEAQRPQVRLIPDCAVKGPRLFGCPQGLDARKVELVWPSGIPSVPVLARVTWKDGQSASVLGAAGQSLLALPAREHPGSVFLNYFRIGIAHILFGWDHLAFVTCLVILAGTRRRILLMVTGFTLGHALTITTASLGYVGLPSAPVEATIALSIMILAAEILRGNQGTLAWRYPVAVASAFGLLHGFGFAGALAETGLSRTELGLSLLAFNLGIELGQLLFIAGLAGIAILLKRRWSPDISASYEAFATAIGMVAAFWFFSRLPSIGT
jgi:hydrogenase/urease accessory protein HupE